MLEHEGATEAGLDNLDDFEACMAQFVHVGGRGQTRSTQARVCEEMQGAEGELHRRGGTTYFHIIEVQGNMSYDGISITW